MELTERLDLKSIHFLNAWSLKDFKQYAKSSCKNDEERKIQFNNLKHFCESNIKAKGEIKRLYAYTEKTPIEIGGRLFSGNSSQGLSKPIRGFLMKHTTDIDMKNAHPTILKYICKLNNILCPNLEYYINNRDEVVCELPNGKTEFLKALNKDTRNTKIKNRFFKLFDAEMKEIQKQIYKLPAYSHIVNSVPTNRSYNWVGSALNRILCVYENKILQSVISVINQDHLEIASLMFDGLMVYGNHYENKELLIKIEERVNQDFDGLNMMFSYKPHDNSISMPDDFEIAIKEKIDESKLKTFEKVSAEFEKNHCKIINKSIFIKELQNNIIVMSKSQMNTSYEHLVYEKMKTVDERDTVLEINFIDDWLRNNKNQRCCDDVGIYPNGLICPEKHFNLWRNFAMEFVTEYEVKEKELKIILNHIKILCGNQEEVYEYFVNWIAQMIQYPAVKSICPVLISKEGAGKGTLLTLLTQMLGNNKVMDTTQPSRDVWGDFNGKMSQSFLVNLNELSKSEMVEAEGKFKGLVTDAKLTINNKGVNQYDIISYHRFIITTNKEEPINTTFDDRRNLIIRSSDEMIGNKEYFNKLNEMLEDVNVVKTCYEYFKQIPNMDNFKSLPMPKTEYQNNLKELSVSPIEQWLKDFTAQHIDETEIELLGKQTYTNFSNWCETHGVKYQIDSKKLGVRLTNLKINGIRKGNHTREGETKIYNIPLLKKHFQLGCLL